MEQSLKDNFASAIEKAGNPQNYIDALFDYLSKETDYFKGNNKVTSRKLLSNSYSKYLSSSILKNKNANEPKRILVLGASGRVGSKVVDELKGLKKDHPDFQMVLATRSPEKTKQWKEEGHEVVKVDLNQPETFDAILTNIDSVFLLTGYTVEMIIQSKHFIDACVRANVSHIVHLGVFSGATDLIPHFNWHVMIERYISESGLAWTNVHPNVIWSPEDMKTPQTTGHYYDNWSGKKQGYVSAMDIGAVVARVLVEGPEKHNGKDYWLSIELLTSEDIAKNLSEAYGKEIVLEPFNISGFRNYIETIKWGEKTYMESAVITMKLAGEEKMMNQLIVKDDVQTVCGRPGITIKEWAMKNNN